jgi:hypothetical protein
MSKAEILQQLPKLKPSELREIQDRIFQLEEDSLLNGRSEPTEEEKKLLDRELKEYSKDPNAGSDWQEVQSRLKQ